MIITTPLPAPPSWWESWALHTQYPSQPSQASSWVSDKAQVTEHSSEQLIHLLHFQILWGIPVKTPTENTDRWSALPRSCSHAGQPSTAAVGYSCCMNSPNNSSESLQICHTESALQSQPPPPSAEAKSTPRGGRHYLLNGCNITVSLLQSVHKGSPDKAPRGQG